jgi:GT2 family glycosyltransferase
MKLPIRRSKFVPELDELRIIDVVSFGENFFDKDFYLRRFLDVGSVDPMLHWFTHGASEGRSPHPLVDIEFYRKSNSDVPVGEELHHYLNHGWHEGRSISPFIRTDLLLEQYPEWPTQGISPLEFLCWKLKDGIDISTGLLDTSELPISMGATPLDRLSNYLIDGLALPCATGYSVGNLDCNTFLGQLDSSQSQGPNDWKRFVSVVIPIHSDHLVTRAMLDRLSEVTADASADADVILILDGAEESIRTYARSLATPNLTIIDHPKSLGFSNAVNAGFRAAEKDRHVLVLNADVLPRLQVFTLLYEALISDPSLASVTSVTNFGSIASYPTPGKESRWLPEDPDSVSKSFETDEYDRLVTKSAVCVGHCVLIRRSALDDVGYFDAVNFPEGYGEEVDWSLRASKMGWQHGIANKAFVWHQGSTSFKARKNLLLQIGERKLQSLYGSRYEEIKDSLDVTKSELLFRFQYLDAHIVKKLYSPSKAVLTHSSGGGTFEFIDRQNKDHSDSIFIFLDTSSPIFRVSVGQCFLPALELNPIPLENLSKTLAAFGVNEIEVHTGVSADSRAFYLQLSRFLGKSSIFLHDFSPYCARINLVGGNSSLPSFCGAPEDEATCQECIDKHGSLIGASPIRDLRDAVRVAFHKSDRISVPHKSSADIWKRWGIETEIVRHNTDTSAWGSGKTQKRLDSITLLNGERSKQISQIARSSEGRPKVLIPGRISYAKGAGLVRDVVVLNRVYGSPLEFILCGEIDSNVLKDLTLFNTVIGDYDKKLPHLVKSMDIDAVWLTSIWPETYMYVLDDLADLSSKNFLYLNSDIGAPIERARSAGFKKLVQVPVDPVRIITQMINDFLPPKLKTSK